MAALTGTLAGTQQGIISFTRGNEQEADRIGIQVLQRAGFDPQAMPAFLQKLADQSRFSSKPPEILLTHPLPDSRGRRAQPRQPDAPGGGAVVAGFLYGEGARAGHVRHRPQSAD